MSCVSPGEGGPLIKEGAFMDICNVKLLCEIVSGLSALVAVILGFYASWIGFRTSISIFDKNAQVLATSLAAFCAGLTALLQIIVTAFMPVCSAFA
jgi:hypothetical protein